MKHSNDLFGSGRWWSCYWNHLIWRWVVFTGQWKKLEWWEMRYSMTSCSRLFSDCYFCVWVTWWWFNKPAVQKETDDPKALCPMTKRILGFEHVYMQTEGQYNVGVWRWQCQLWETCTPGGATGKLFHFIKTGWSCSVEFLHELVAWLLLLFIQVV